MPSHSQALPPLAFDPPPQCIAVFRALYLGDLLCAVPALRALRARYPQAEITLIGLSWASMFVERFHRYIDRFVEFPGYPGLPEIPLDLEEIERFFAEQQAYGYDLALQMHGNGTISNGFIAGLRARSTVGYTLKPDERLTIGLAYDEREHEIRRWLRLAAAVDARSDDPTLELPTTPAEAERAETLLLDAPPGSGPLVGLHVGSKELDRRWPHERFAALANALVAQFAARIVLTGGPDERLLTAAVQEQLHSPALDLAGKTELGVLVEVIRRLDLLVTNDSSPSHVAAVTRTRSVILYGPDETDRWAPLNRQLHHPVDAKLLAGPDVDPFVALQQLPVDVVLAACNNALGQHNISSFGKAT